MEQVEQGKNKITEALKPYSEKLKFTINLISECKNTYRILLNAGESYANIPYTRVLMVGFKDKIIILAIDKEDVQDLLHSSTLLPKS